MHLLPVHLQQSFSFDEVIVVLLELQDLIRAFVNQY